MGPKTDETYQKKHVNVEGREVHSSMSMHYQLIITQNRERRYKNMGPATPTLRYNAVGIWIRDMFKLKVYRLCKLSIIQPTANIMLSTS